MEKLNIRGLEAVIAAQSILLNALVSTHHDRAKLRKVFSELMSRMIAATDDPMRSGILQSFEETYRELLDGPGL